jgi:hypothetical protein
MAGASLGSGSRLEAGPATPSGIYVTEGFTDRTKQVLGRPRIELIGREDIRGLRSSSRRMGLL